MPEEREFHRLRSLDPLDTADRQACAWEETTPNQEKKHEKEEGRTTIKTHTSMGVVYVRTSQRGISSCFSALSKVPRRGAHQWSDKISPRLKISLAPPF